MLLIKHLMNETVRFDPATFPSTILGRATSFDFVKPNTYTEDSYWFTSIKDLFDKYHMN